MDAYPHVKFPSSPLLTCFLYIPYLEVEREKNRKKINKKKVKMSPSCLIFLVSNSIFLLSLFSFTIHAHDCTEDFWSEAQNRNLTLCKRYKHRNGVEFGWNIDNTTRSLQIMVGARLESETGWLAWGLNFGPVPRMVGTQALIGIKQTNGSFLGDTYNVTQYIKIGCKLLPSPIDLNISNLRFRHIHYYHIIEATIHLPQTVNVSRINQVWQVGKVAMGMEPKIHERKLHNYDSTETIDLQTGTVITVRGSRRRQARIAHGILNIIGWGVILPIGVIIARYFKKGPINWNEHDQWKHAHKTCQTCGYIIGATGWALGLWLGASSKYYSFPKHGAFGISIFTFATLQTLALRLKPRKNDELHTYWSIYHLSLGYALLAVICVNIFKGIKIMQDVDTWRSVYIAVIVSLTFIFLVLEIINWLRFKVDQLKKEKEIK
ncbi:cytochrome b561 and DOMON domain-containing protein At5g47530-like [Lycium ferocissimum]|uniref:cytochrome b561 and DOMON domain-containing protein At5g47530-like n=1 Tax=Lycium ferocissimum TaxID=112874 RepID=UPI002815F326|nr:cytochrome b561 and DOMON domain-containing protein At5g47530-like [Lycium ferocissimum]